MNRAKVEIIYGTQSVKEALLSKTDIEKILVRKDNENESIKKILHDASIRNIPIQKVPLSKINSVTRKNHQGILAYIAPISYASLDHIIHETFRSGKDPLFVLLDRITDVRNFGAIARTAEGLGFHGLIIPMRGGALLNREAMKTSAGALAHIPVCRVKNLSGTINYLRNNGIQVIACSDKGKEIIYRKNLKGPVTLVLGSESEGISREVMEACNAVLRIPMLGKIGSYNVSVSMAIAGSEIIRQRTELS
jgi:23S rRNA (guanosine2251-2'-O)-methyltransferase